MTTEEALAILNEDLACHPNMTRKQWYGEVYLRSDHWKNLRKQAKKHHGKKCAKCPCVRRLDVHHLNYRNIYDVTVDDLQVLCRKCHQREHGSVPVIQVTTVFPPKKKKPFKPHRDKRSGIIWTTPPAHGGKMVSKRELQVRKLRMEAAREM